MFWSGWGKIVKGWRLAMLDGREAMWLSVSLKAVVYFDLFQFTLPRRERRNCSGGVSRFCRFQSTLPRRERPQENAPACPPAHFNPRSREGSDFGRLSIKQTLTNFNPHSREGSDNARVWYKITYKIFQSTLPRRGRPPHRSGACWGGHFNPRSREGSDATEPATSAPPFNFNPRSREGSDPKYAS